MRLGSSKNVFLKPGLTENTEVLYISEWCLFPETWGFFFSDIYCENLVELLEAKPWKAWQLPVSGSHWSFVATQIFFFFFWWELRLVCTEPPAICQLSFKFSHSSTGSWGGFECSSKVRLLYLSVSPTLVAVIPLCPYLSYESKNPEKLLIFQSLQCFTCY